MDELAQLRAELSEVRDLAEATLMALVGKDKVVLYEMEASVQHALRRRRGATPLQDFFGGKVLDKLSWDRHGGWGLETLEELVAQRSRDELAALPGVGPSRLERVDAAVAARELTWAVAV